MTAVAEDACNMSASRIHGRRQSTVSDGTVPSIVDLADFKGDWVQFLTGQACGDGPVQPSIQPSSPAENSQRAFVRTNIAAPDDPAVGMRRKPWLTGSSGCSPVVCDWHSTWIKNDVRMGL